MGALIWDAEGERLYETGLDHGTLYVYDAVAKTYGHGVAWSGLSSLSESPEGAEANDIYADNIKYLSLISAENFKASIEAYMYPDEFAECDGTKSILDGVSFGQQSRSKFGLAYRTKNGNDTEGDDHGYKIHLIYGCTAAPSEKGYQSTSDSPEAITFSWEISTTPVNIGKINNKEFKPSATVTIDSTKFKDNEKLAVLEACLFGRDSAEGDTELYPTLLMPNEIYDILTKGEAGIPERAKAA